MKLLYGLEVFGSFLLSPVEQVKLAEIGDSFLEANW